MTDIRVEGHPATAATLPYGKRAGRGSGVTRAGGECWAAADGIAILVAAASAYAAGNARARARAPARSSNRVYSVSVLAHMTRAEREETVDLVSQWLEPGGRLLLAVDLLPKSDFLWNRSEGVEVEPPTEHGTVDDLFRSVDRAGLRVTERKIRRTVFASRTDLLFLETVRAG